MELRVTLAKGVLACSLFWIVLGQLHVGGRWQWLANRRLQTSIYAALVAIVLEHAILRPYFLSPLRHIPTVKGAGDAAFVKLMLERPRGESALKWMKANPKADILHVRGLFRGSALVPVSPEVFRQIKSYNIEKLWAIRSTLARVIGFGLIVSNGDAHKAQRKALTPAFHIRNIRGTIPLMWSKTAVFVSQIGAEAKKTGFVELGSWASRLTLDIIGHAALSRDFGALTSEDNPIADSFGKLLEPTLGQLLLFAMGFVLPQFIIRKLPININKVFDDNVSFLRKTCGEILREKKASLAKSTFNEKSAGIENDADSDEGEEENADIMGDIIRSNSFSDTEIVDQMLTFLAAGHDTTASALTWCSYLLALNPDIQQRLRAELRSKVPPVSSAADTAISYKLFESLPILHGVCEETLRLYPTIPSTIREVTKDMLISEVLVPQGTNILIVPVAINRNPRFWGADAEKMRPERWIDTAADGTQTLNKHGGAESNMCIQTFLHGSRSCIGREFAKAELRCAVAGMVQSYEISLFDPNEKIEVAGVVTTKPSCGMKLVLKELGSTD